MPGIRGGSAGGLAAGIPAPNVAPTGDKIAGATVERR
jgi:hypothetical protein